MSRPRAVVVGGGIYGWGCALRMAELGASVTVVDPRAIDDEQRASGGVTRVLRLEYGDASRYSGLALRARDRWRQIESLTGTTLYREDGMLFLVPEGDDGAWERASLDALRELGVAGVEMDPAAIVARWPAIRSEGISWGVHNPIGGILWAHRATRAVADLAIAAGVSFVDDRAVASDGAGVDLASGARVDADVVVIATGSWSSTLLPGIDITPTRQVTAFLAGGPADVPVFGDGAPFAFYGMPAHDGMGMKIGSHITGPKADPDDPAARVATPADLDPIRDYAERRFGVTGAAAEIVRADVCFYAMTPTEDPVIERLPDGRVVCAGFSGHGFKFAPVVSAAVAEWALGGEPVFDLGASGR